MDSVPASLKSLRCCMLCKMIKSFEQFRNDGCDNCEELLNMRDNSERVLDCTSASFTGMVAMISPTKSWVSKWQRADQAQPGLYALKVFGKLPEEIVEDLERLDISHNDK